MNSESQSKLRVGLLVSRTHVSYYIHEFVLWAQSQPNIQVACLVLHDAKDQTAFRRALRVFKQEGLERTLARSIFRLVVKMEGLVLRFSKAHSRHLKSEDIAKLVENTIVVTPLLSRSGYVQRFSKADIDRIAALKLDVLIRCGNGILRGDILHAAKFGILSFHHGDNRINRGGPAGFWEVYHRWDKTGFTIQQLTEELDGGIALKRGFFPTQFTFLINQSLLFRQSHIHLQALISSIARTGQLPQPLEPLPYSAMLFRAPNSVQSLAYAVRLFSALLTKLASKVANFQPRWTVSYVRSNWREAVFWRSRSIPNPPGRFLADPFAIARGDKTYCFVEDYVYRTGRGHISVCEIDKNDQIRIEPCLQEPFHLSFPFLFHVEDDLFMCPETSEKNEIRVYRCTEFPRRWKLERILMQNVCAADTMLFEHGGKWWMFTNIDPTYSGHHTSELYLFYSDSALSTNWTPHPLNPVIIDPEFGRNAGLINERDRKIRVAQRQAFDTYGKGISVFEIEVLTESDYRERKIGSIDPHYKRGIYGTHHLATTGEMTFIDHVTMTFVR